MKLKINKASDLSSISVLPPHARRSSGASNGVESSIFGKSQTASQLRSQPSFSQGVSSSQQGGLFSQLSQNSIDEIVTNDQLWELHEVVKECLRRHSACSCMKTLQPFPKPYQRFGSQEKENSTKKLSLMPQINNTREESQIQLSRSSTSVMRKWNSAALDQRCQMSEELEHKIGMMETSLSRFGMILDSVQSDIMQVNKGRKEAAFEMESIRQKLNASDNTMQLMNKGQEDIKATLDRAVNSIFDQLSQNKHQESLQQIFPLLSGLPKMIEVYTQKLQNDISKNFTKEMQEMACSLKIPNQNLTTTVQPPNAVSHTITLQARQPIKNSSTQAAHTKAQQSTVAPKVEMGTWNSVKREKSNFMNRDSSKGQKQKGIPPTELERDCRINIESDEEIDGGFCCLLEDKETDKGNFSTLEARKETERILRKARRRKRKCSNTIIIN